MSKCREILEALETEEPKKVIISLPATNDQPLDIVVDRDYALKNLDTISSEEHRVVLVFDKNYLVFEEGLGGIYMDDNIDELRYYRSLQVMNPSVSIDNILNNRIDNLNLRNCL